MRSPDRIKPFLNILEECWNKVPDWRFGQLMVNFLGQLPRDPFFYEENEMEEELKRFFQTDKKKRE